MSAANEAASAAAAAATNAAAPTESTPAPTTPAASTVAAAAAATAPTTLIRGTTHNDETGEEEEFTIETIPLSALSRGDTDKLQSLAAKVLNYFDDLAAPEETPAAASQKTDKDQQ